MGLQKISIDSIILNAKNPREITEINLNKLIESLLVFPAMLELRPIVVDQDNVILGGNMRKRALSLIKSMNEHTLLEYLNKQHVFNAAEQKDKDKLLYFWLQWQKNPVVPCVLASDLSFEQRQQFIIKDNINFGTWEMGMLADDWDCNLLNDWGVDIFDDEADEEDNNKIGKAKNVTTENFFMHPFAVVVTYNNDEMINLGVNKED